MYRYRDTYTTSCKHPEGHFLARLAWIRDLESGMRIRGVSRKYNMSPNTVRRWWRRYQAEGTSG